MKCPTCSGDAAVTEHKRKKRGAIYVLRCPTCGNRPLKADERKALQQNNPEPRAAASNDKSGGDKLPPASPAPEQGSKKKSGGFFYGFDW